MTCGYSLHGIRLQPPWHAVTASMTCGYSLYDIRLQEELSRSLDPLVLDAKLAEEGCEAPALADAVGCNRMSWRL